MNSDSNAINNAVSNDGAMNIDLNQQGSSNMALIDMSNAGTVYTHSVDSGYISNSLQLAQSQMLNQASNSPTNQIGLNGQYDASIFDLNTVAPNEEALRREHEAMEIVIQARETLIDAGKFEQFHLIIQTCQESPIKAFVQLHNLCKGHPELQELLLDLLTPEQALELSPIVYAQHCLRNDMKKFCKEIKNAYSSNPSNQAGSDHHTKIFKELHQFISQDNHERTVDDLRNFASKLFKGQDQLIDSFKSYLPGHTEERSKIWNSIEPEMIDLSDEENDAPHGLTQNEQNQFQGYEHIKNIPETEEEKLYGTDQCPCKCHPKQQSASNHCIHCSIRFINGKVYAREGKVLKPVKVKYPAGKNPFVQNENNSTTGSVTNQISPSSQHANLSKN